MITAQIQAILFASGKPVALSTLKKTLNVSDEVLSEAVSMLREQCNREDSGIHLLEHEGKVQLVTNPAMAELVSSLVRDELAGDLTRPQLETLTIVAYRGPVTKPEIEQIRGINCTLIIRNLLMRGLIEEQEDTQRLQPVYTLSADFVRHLGLHSTSELPDYESLHSNERITQMLSELENKTPGV